MAPPRMTRLPLLCLDGARQKTSFDGAHTEIINTTHEVLVHVRLFIVITARLHDTILNRLKVDTGEFNCSRASVLARNEEFSKIAVINFFFTVLKKKIQLSVGGILRGKFRDIPRKSTV